MPNEGEKTPWVPTSREEWSEVFADGLDLHRSRREEAEAKKNAETPPKQEGGDNGGNRKRTLGDLLLGN